MINIQDVFIHLQLFNNSNEKTEKPTTKRRERAREEGQVARSTELNNAVLLLSSFIILKLSGKWMYHKIIDVFKNCYTRYLHDNNIFTIKGMNVLLIETTISLIVILIPIFAATVVVSLLVSILQVGWKVTTQLLEPKLDRLNPISGFKRIFSPKIFVELLKSILKILIIGFVVYGYIEAQMKNIPTILNKDFSEILAYGGSSVVKMATVVSVVYFVLAGLDYLYQKYEFEKSIKMTKQEIKEEFKQSEGDPQIKSKIKQKQREISMKRMMQDIPKADVIITNPTHFAVAVTYKPEQGLAPIVVAKGQDYLAQRIKNIAKDNKIHIIENKPLARAIYFSTDVGEEIPQELYQAVAEVLAFIYSMKNS